jgi:hypothetical protein
VFLNKLSEVLDVKISNIMVALIAALGLLLTTPGWSKKPTKISGSLPLPVSQKELMCHKGRQIIDISVNALPAHAAHGDWVVDDANPCPAEGDGAPSLCLDTNNRDFDVGILNHVLADLPGPLFDINEELLYLPQVRIEVLGVFQTFAVILERFSDTDFVVRYMQFLPDPVEGVAFVEFNGTSTGLPFNVDEVAGDVALGVIEEVELSVLEGCRPVQLSVTNFLIIPNTTTP